jgi:hypothetical protein
MQSRLVPVILLAASAAGMLWFSQRLTVADTIALLACGLVAGGSLAALAAMRTRGKRA